MNETIKNILGRTGTTEYLEKQVPEEDLQLILSAGRAAPNAYNAQKWHFTVVQKKELLEEIDKATFDALDAIGDIGDDERDYQPLYGAPTLIILSADREHPFGKQDCSCANQNMALAAKSLGLSSRFLDVPNLIFTGERKAEFLEKCQIPAGYETICQLVVGYPQEPDEKPKEKRADVVTYIR